MLNYGIVFKADGKVFLALYDKEGNIQDGQDISTEGTYDYMPPNVLTIVSVEYEGENIHIHDLKGVVVEKDGFEADTVLPALLTDGNFPILAKEIYQDLFDGHIEEKSEL